MPWPIPNGASPRPLTTVGLMALEISLHGWVAVRYLGWESGFHHYLMLVLPVAIVSKAGFTASMRKWCAGAGVAAVPCRMAAGRFHERRARCISCRSR